MLLQISKLFMGSIKHELKTIILVIVAKREKEINEIGIHE